MAFSNSNSKNKNRVRSKDTKPLIKAFLLDVDGTLVDSNDLHARAWVDALTHAGFVVPYSAVRPLVGMGGDKLLPALLGTKPDDPLAIELGHYRGELFRKKYLARVRAFPNTRKLLVYLRRQGFTLVVATSASKKDLDQLLKQGKISDLLPLRVNSDDVNGSKPDPDIVMAALKKAKVDKQEALMIGDTPYDMAAARRAGVASIGFTCGGWEKEKLADAVEIYGSPAQMLKSFKTTREYLLGQSHYF